LYNIETIINSIPIVLKKFPNAKFVFLRGKIETQEKELLSLIEKLGITDAVRYEGYVVNTEDIPSYFSLADIYISVPIFDRSSSALQEAMASGAIPVASDIPANRAWIKNGHNGFLVPVKDYNMLAASICSLIRNKSMREDFARINRDLVVERSDKDKQQIRFERIYESLFGTS
jgi:glycosyltransferase involved in cell wall biosynthesis